MFLIECWLCYQEGGDGGADMMAMMALQADSTARVGYKAFLATGKSQAAIPTATTLEWTGTFLRDCWWVQYRFSRL